jgi:hypothetical protein
MTAFPFAALDIPHFRFNAGLVYLGPVNPFKSKHEAALPTRDILIYNPLFSNSYRGLTE